MASNEVEVLDPAPTVENLKKSASDRVLNRRHFIAALGVAGAAVAGTELVRQGPTALAQQPKPNGYAQNDVLNFLLNLVYLKASLYSFITTGADLPAATFDNLGSGGVYNPPKQVTFAAAGPATAAEITDLFNELFYDEVNRLTALRTLIGPAAVITRPTINFAGTGTTTATAAATVTAAQAIGLMRMLVDLAATAYAGSLVYLTGTNLAYVSQSLAATCFHSGALRLIAIQAGVPYLSPQNLTTGSTGAQTVNSVSASTISGSTTLYNFAPTNPLTVGSIVSGTGIPLNTTITAVNPPTVYTGVLNGTTGAPTLSITNVSPTTGLAVGMTLAGSGIPANSIITSITGNTVTIGAITGFSALTPPTPITNGVTGVTGTGGFGMTVDIYDLVFSGGGGGTGAAGKLTVLTAGTSATSLGTYSITLTSTGSGYTTVPTVSAATGGTQPTLTAAIPAQITTTSASVTLTPGFTAATTKGGTTLIYVSQTAGLTPGQMLTGTGLPASVNIAASGINAATGVITMQTATGTAVSASATSSVAPTGLVTNGSNVITNVSSVSGILFGMPITGTDVAAGATVTGVGSDQNGLTITMSAPGKATSSTKTTVGPTCLLTSGSPNVTDLSSLSGLAVGNAVTGVNIPAGTTITAVGGVNTMVLSKNATASTATVVQANKPTAVLQSGNNLISSVSVKGVGATGFANGQLITDSQGNIPPNTTITAVTASNFTLTLSAPATGSTTLTTVATPTGTVVNNYQTISSVTPTSVFSGSGAIAPGMIISGTNIPTGSIITAIDAVNFTITINNFPTASGGPVVTTPLIISTGTVLTATALQAITVTTVTPSEAVTIPTLVTVTPSLGTATLSQAATVTGVNTLTLQTADAMDVEPYDPGTAALASAGPAALAGTSPAVYRGFFDTAGGSTASANNPAGAVFARTFSQVLAALYGSTAAQTFQGGFFPVGVGGGINFV